MREITRCTRCIMDNSSDDTIRFDAAGQCNYCTDALSQKDKIYFPNAEGESKLQNLLREVKTHGAGHPYDCIMGISGGLDSSYLAYLGYQWGLRVLAVHIDDGFDSEISKHNIEKLIKATDFEYLTIRPDAEQYNGLTKAYMKAGVPNIAIPQDNVLFAFLYDCMKKYGIKYFFSGSNFALESILQRGNAYKSTDVVNIRDINRRFGNTSINKLKFISTIDTYLNVKVHRIKTVMPLNYVEYNRDKAFEELRDFCGFEYYGRKHLENHLTEFIQLYWFYEKFGVDKRSSHLSSMIVSDQMSRDAAMQDYAEPIYEPNAMKTCIEYVKGKLSMSDLEFEQIMAAPTHQHFEYAVEDNTLIYRFLRVLVKMEGQIFGRQQSLQ